MSTAETDADGVLALGASRVGAELRAARQRLGWPLANVSHTLRIRLPYLEAIEDGRVADLPGNAYAVGFVRTYATSLGLDAAEVARRFRAEAQEVNRKTELSFPAPVPERGVPVMAVVLIGLFVVGLAYAGWYRMSGAGRPVAELTPVVPERLAMAAAPPSNPSPQVASILPVPALPVVTSMAPGPVQPAAPILPPSPPVAPAAAVGDSRVVLRLKADAWVQVREKQGPVLLNRILRSGETWPVPKGTQLVMTTGNAGGTEVLVDGQVAPSLGALGAIRRDVSLEPDALKAGSARRAVPAQPAAPGPAVERAPL